MLKIKFKVAGFESKEVEFKSIAAKGEWREKFLSHLKSEGKSLEENPELDFDGLPGEEPQKPDAEKQAEAAEVSAQLVKAKDLKPEVKALEVEEEEVGEDV